MVCISIFIPVSDCLAVRVETREYYVIICVETREYYVIIRVETREYYNVIMPEHCIFQMSQRDGATSSEQQMIAYLSVIVTRIHLT